MRIELGDQVKDAISGFSGIAVARTEWLHGCIRITIQPEKTEKTGEGKPLDTATFDEGQIVVLKRGKHQPAFPPPPPSRPGGPYPEPRRQAPPQRR